MLSVEGVGSCVSGVDILTLFNLLILWEMGPSVIITRNAEMESGGGWG